MDVSALSEHATLGRFNAAQDRIARDFGFGDTEGALGITRDALGTLTAYIARQFKVAPQLMSAVENDLIRTIIQLEPAIIALSLLNSALHAVTTSDDRIRTCRILAAGVQDECWARGLLQSDGKLSQRISKAVRLKHGSFKYRRQAAKSIAKRAGFTTERWAPRLVAIAGDTFLHYLTDGLPDLFVIEETSDGTKTRKWLTITEKALAIAEKAVEQTLCANPVFLPMDTTPAPWVSMSDGAYSAVQSRFHGTVVRAYYKESVAAIKAAIRSGAMQPHLDALNTLQAVPWTINTRVREVVQWAYENEIGVKGVPLKKSVAVPAKDAAWEDMDEPAKRVWKHRAAQVKEHNRGAIADRVLLCKDMLTAQRLEAAGRFWTPMNCDWRGRVYSIPHFNFQRDDRVRAMFLFADGQPIGEEGLYWLKVHVANCGDFNKISKRPIAERVQWVDQNSEALMSYAARPKLEQGWTVADKPFLFLAACMELARVVNLGPNAVTVLPVSFDGSCSGLQHLCAMTRATEGSLVNLTPSALPQDVYQSVADLVTKWLETAAAEGNDLAKTCLAYGVTRSVVKRNVMTYSYSSKKFGMAQQLNEDLMRPLAFQVLSGKSTSHPFGDEDGRPASKYLAGLIYQAIETLVEKPAEAMGMLQKCARALAHEGKPVSWTTPLGLPWVNRYHLPNLERLDLWLHDTRVQMVYADGFKKEIDKDKASNGVAPNFVHACDAAHLLMVANAAAAEGITQLATVHDSFGCLAPHAAHFRKIIREQFVRLYEDNDVLMQVLVQCKHDLTVHNQQRLPDAPAYGPLKLQEVLDADFAFA